jgi:hypothetical protein
MARSYSREQINHHSLIGGEDAATYVGPSVVRVSSSLHDRVAAHILPIPFRWFVIQKLYLCNEKANLKFTTSVLSCRCGVRDTVRTGDEAVRKAPYEERHAGTESKRGTQVSSTYAKVLHTWVGTVIPV